MTITVNGVRTELDGAPTVEEFVVARAGSARGSAVVVDGEVVPRSRWAAQRLRAGCTVEIVTAVQGG